ncbi:hypothetical protein [Abiotrophia defectiva]|uniref:hypothetical protein n=1 Tax=Abiotrophia defectiva TaxID=46125 RepID=UPI0028EE9343|nr:hypothetical protein [Abiotrophia defectiva]
MKLTRNIKDVYSSLTSLTRGIIFFSFILFIIMIILLLFQSANSIEIIGNLFTALTIFILPEVYSVIQKRNEKRKETERNILLIRKIMRELNTNKKILDSIYYSNTTNVSKSALYFIDYLEGSIWEKNKDSVDLDEKLTEKIDGLVRVILIFKNSYSKIEVDELEGYIAYIIQKIEEATTKLDEVLNVNKTLES